MAGKQHKSRHHNKGKDVHRRRMIKGPDCVIGGEGHSGTSVVDDGKPHIKAQIEPVFIHEEEGQNHNEGGKEIPLVHKGCEGIQRSIEPQGAE